MIDTKSLLLSSLRDALELGAAERCGLVLADGTLAEVDNIHPEPARGFEMCPKAFLLVVADAVATWHTHPGKDPNLSQEDRNGFRQWPNLIHHIVGIRDGEPAVHSFKVVEGGIVVTA